MSATKAALRSELNIKTRTSNKLKSEEKPLEEYEPNNLLAEQVTDAIHQYFDEREEIYADLPETQKKDDLELTADVYDDVPLIASRKHENGGLYLNMASASQGITSKNTQSTNVPLINFGGNTFGNNYNAYNLKNSTLPQDGLTTEKMKRGFYTSFQYNPERYWGKITDKALLESMGYPGQRKIVGIPM
jgi:hypothetical protein